MTINSTGERVDQHTYANERTGEIIYRLVDPATTDYRVITVKEEPLHNDFFHRLASGGYRSY